MKLLKRLTNKQKTNFIILFSFVSLFLIIGIPSLARYNNRISNLNVIVWDGTLSTGYRDGTGTQNDPYIISNGNELAYFSEQLKTNDYENTYFKLTKDILLNDGTFDYNNDTITYSIDNITYNINQYTNELRDSSLSNELVDKKVNIFNPINNFKGIFDGDFHTISGLYITSNTSMQLGLFTDLNGSVKNLYLNNAMIYGGNITGGVVSKSVNSILENIVFDGNVVGISELNDESYIPLDSQTISINEENKQIVLNKEDLPFISGDITSLKLTGNCTFDNSTVIINGTIINSNIFEIDLGTDINDIIIDINSTTSDVIELSNLSIEYKTNNSIASGIVALANKTNMNKIINKGNIYGNLYSAGLVGELKESSLNYAYNTGNINSLSISSGLINKITQSSNSTISKVYNNGLVNSEHSANLIGSIINSETSLNYAFGKSNTGYSVYKIDNSTLNAYHAYYYNGIDVYEGTADFTLTTLESLQDKQYLINNLQFLEFSDINNVDNGSVWLYNDIFPTLYIDDINNETATIYSGIYNWNNYSDDLQVIKYDSNITFSIESNIDIDSLSYYISNDILTLEQLNSNEILWKNYENVVRIDDDGLYIIYVKITNNDNSIYINTDKLVLDKTAPNISIEIDNKQWNSYTNDISNYYMDSSKEIIITADDETSGIKKILYYYSDEKLSLKELDKIVNWTNYQNVINFNSNEKNILYVKVIDNCDYETYVNTDYLIVDGYVENIIVGRNSNISESINITNKSTFSLDFTLENEIKLENYNYNFVSSILLPENTVLTLIDYSNNEIYKYIVTDGNYGYDLSCESSSCKFASYPFELFKSIGKSTNINFEKYSNTLSNHFKIIVDLKNANIVSNIINSKYYINIQDTDTLLSTLIDSIGSVNIYVTNDQVNYDSYLSLTSSFEKEVILNSNSETEIDLISKMNYKTVNNDIINDTVNEDKRIGIAIKFVDENNNIISYNDTKNVYFKVNNKNYYTGFDGIARIDLENGLNDFNGNLVIVTKEDNINLKSGLYYFKIYNYVAYDGISYNDLYNEITIPVLVDDDIVKIQYNFDVDMNSSQIINKTDNNLISFKLLVNGELENPIIKISLYKKDKLTAFDQNYVLVDLKQYILNNLELSNSNVYYVTKTPIIYNGNINTLNEFELNLNLSKFESNGYKFLFQLYDGDKFIGDLDKKFIVK